MSSKEMQASEQAVEASAERLAIAVAALRERMRGSTGGTDPAPERYLDALDLSLRTAGELSRALTRLRDVVKSRMQR